MKRRPHPVRGAYDYADTEKPCPTCRAEPYAWCRNPGTGRVRHSPCVARLVKRDDPEGPHIPPPVLRLIRTTEPQTDSTPTTERNQP